MRLLFRICPSLSHDARDPSVVDLTLRRWLDEGGWHVLERICEYAPLQCTMSVKLHE